MDGTYPHRTTQRGRRIACAVPALDCFASTKACWSFCFCSFACQSDRSDRSDTSARKPCAVESLHQDFQLRSFARDVDVSCPPEHFVRKPGGPEDVEDQKTRKSGGPGRRTRQLGEKTWRTRTTCMTRTTTGPGGPGGPENLEDLEDQENHDNY